MSAVTIFGITEDRLSLREISLQLGVSLNTVQRWTTREGVHGMILPSFLIGGRRFVSRAALEEFLAELNRRSNAKSGCGCIAGPTENTGKSRELATREG